MTCRIPRTYSAALVLLVLATAAKAQFNGAVGSPFSATSASSPISVVAADFDQDSVLDLAVANQNLNTVIIWRGDGTGRFTNVATIQLPSGSQPSALATADFDGDGLPDVAIVCLNAPGPGAVYVWLNDLKTTKPGITLKGPFTVGYLPNFVVAGNFGSGNMDLAVSNSKGSAVSSLSGSISVLTNDGKGTFSNQAGSPYLAGPGPSSIAVADFNGDGHMDLAISNAQLPNPPLMQTNYTVTVLLGSANGFVQAPLGPFLVGTKALTAIAAADFNNDLIPDLAVTGLGNTVTVLLGNGDGSFTPASGTPAMAGSGPVFMTAADFNGDRNADLAVVDNVGNITVLLGNGMGGFTAAMGSPYAVEASPTSLAVADFNSDGKPDLAVVNDFSDDISVLLNSIVTVPSMTLSTTLTTGSVAPASLVTILGTGFGPGGTLPTGVPSLGPPVITVTDASGVKSAPVTPLYAGPTQINLVLPTATAIGAGTFSVSIPNGPIQTGPMTVAAVAPGLFSANATGKGPALAAFIENPLTAPNLTSTFSCPAAPENPNPYPPDPPANCAPIQLDVSGGNSFLILYGTGIRNRTSLAQVTATIDSMTFPVSYAGPASMTPSDPLDAVDAVLIVLPITLIHAGVVNATVSIGTATSNSVTLNFK